MNILGNGDMDDSWLEGNANGREDALKEVLEELERLSLYPKSFAVTDSVGDVHKLEGCEGIHGAQVLNQYLQAWLTKKLSSITQKDNHMEE